MFQKGKWQLYALLFFILSTIILAFFLYQKQNKTTTEASAMGVNDCAYQYLNPLRCEPSRARPKKEYVALRNELLEFIEEEKKNGRATHVSVYFRDLQNGPTMSIEGNENFAPASLLKVPLLITYYKKAENDVSLLKRKVKVVGDLSSLPQNIKPSESAVIGKEYQIDELLSLLITQSDNTSWKVLLADLRQQYSEEDFVVTLSDLGIIDPRAKGDQYVTVQAYASLFRILYNSSYLTIPMSDKALTLLSQSTFKDGLVYGVPDGTRVAHKFGEYKNGPQEQLHDCGIVYYPPNPYLLCVMTKGDNISELLSIIQYVSKEVYEEVASRQ